MNYTLSLTFITETKEKATFTITDIDESLTEEQIKALAATIIANPVFDNKKGAFKELYSAKIVGKETTDFKIA